MAKPVKNSKATSSKNRKSKSKKSRSSKRRSSSRRSPSLASIKIMENKYKLKHSSNQRKTKSQNGKL